MGALRSVRVATKKTLKGLNQAAAKRMARGDYAGAEALAGKGRDIAQFQQQTDALLRAWRDVSGRGSKTGKAAKGEVTPLWGYYQPCLKAIVAAGGECLRSDIEAALEADDFLQGADRSPMSGGRERWKVMIRRARKPLRAEGWIEDEISTKWRVTDKGRKAADRPASGGAVVSNTKSGAGRSGERAVGREDGRRQRLTRRIPVVPRPVSEVLVPLTLQKGLGRIRELQHMTLYPGTCRARSSTGTKSLALATRAA